nr:hypothetical protein BaRGS_013390 [Batillaria attramentaria]
MDEETSEKKRLYAKRREALRVQHSEEVKDEEQLKKMMPEASEGSMNYLRLVTRYARLVMNDARLVICDARLVICDARLVMRYPRLVMGYPRLVMRYPRLVMGYRDN